MFIFFFLFVCVRIINKYAVIESLYLTWANRPSQTHPNPNSETIALAFDTKKKQIDYVSTSMKHPNVKAIYRTTEIRIRLAYTLLSV